MPSGLGFNPVLDFSLVLDHCIAPSYQTEEVRLRRWKELKRQGNQTHTLLPVSLRNSQSSFVLQDTVSFSRHLFPCN